MQTREPGTPLTTRFSSTNSTMSAIKNSAGDMFTRRMKSPSGKVFIHPAMVRQASAKTQRPMLTMSPVSSATVMNSAAGIMPRVGCSQRTRASKASSRPVRRSTSGWKCRRRPPSSIASRRLNSSSLRALSTVRSCESKTTA